MRLRQQPSTRAAHYSHLGSLEKTPHLGSAALNCDLTGLRWSPGNLYKVESQIENHWSRVKKISHLTIALGLGSKATGYLACEIGGEDFPSRSGVPREKEYLSLLPVPYSHPNLSMWPLIFPHRSLISHVLRTGSYSNKKRREASCA